MTFETWLYGNYSDKSDIFGDFTRKVGGDPDFPETDDYKIMKDYVRLNYEPADFSALSKLWTRYQCALRDGAAEDEVFKANYQEIWVFAWKTMKHAMRHDSKQGRLEVWETARDHFQGGMCVSCPEFGHALLDLVRNELVREWEGLPFLTDNLVG